MSFVAVCLKIENSFLPGIRIILSKHTQFQITIYPYIRLNTPLKPDQLRNDLKFYKTVTHSSSPVSNYFVKVEPFSQNEHKTYIFASCRLPVNDTILASTATVPKGKTSREKRDYRKTFTTTLSNEIERKTNRVVVIGSH